MAAFESGVAGSMIGSTFLRCFAGERLRSRKRRATLRKFAPNRVGDDDGEDKVLEVERLDGMPPVS